MTQPSQHITSQTPEASTPPVAPPQDAKAQPKSVQDLMTFMATGTAAAQTEIQSNQTGPSWSQQLARKIVG